MELINPNTYNDYEKLRNILTDPEFDPNIMLQEKGIIMPAWLWVMYISNDINLIHFVLSNEKINLDEVSPKFVLDLAKNKDPSIYDRIVEYLDPFAQFKKLFYNKLPFNVMNTISEYGKVFSWKDISLYQTIKPYDISENNTLQSMAVYNSILAIGRTDNIWLFDFSQGAYLSFIYKFSSKNIDIYQDTIIAGGINYEIMLIKIGEQSEPTRIQGKHFREIKVAINDKYIIYYCDRLYIFDRNTLALSRIFMTYTIIKDLSLDGDILCANGEYSGYIYNLTIDANFYYKVINLPTRQIISKIAVKGDTIIMITNLKDINICKFDLNDCLNVFPTRVITQTIDEYRANSILNPQCLIISKPHTLAIKSLAFKNNIIATCDSKSIKLFDLNTQQLLKEIIQQDVKICLIDNNMLICGLKEGDIKIYK